MFCKSHKLAEAQQTVRRDQRDNTGIELTDEKTCRDDAEIRGFVLKRNSTPRGRIVHFSLEFFSAVLLVLELCAVLYSQQYWVSTVHHSYMEGLASGCRARPSVGEAVKTIGQVLRGRSLFAGRPAERPAGQLARRTGE
jgi:hypothetical protein